MKRISFLIVAAAAAFGAGAADESGLRLGPPLFLEDFSSKTTIGDNWVATRDRAQVVDGKLRFYRNMTAIRWNGDVPLEFAMDMTFSFDPAWAEKRSSEDRGWAGIGIEGAAGFDVKPGGSTFLLAGHDTKYLPIKDFKKGSKIRLRVARTKCGSGVRYLFFVNGVPSGEFTRAMPEKIGHEGRYFQPSIATANEDLEIDEVVYYPILSSDTSPNMVWNSGFEYATEGVPPHVELSGAFNWCGCPYTEYEGWLADNFVVDTNEKHSGKQSLKVAIDNRSTSLIFTPSGHLTQQGQSGVLSMWMKTSAPGTKVSLSYGNGSRTFTIGPEWKRYEVCASTLPKPSWFQRVVSCSIQKPKGAKGYLWIDDMQAEFVESPEKIADRQREKVRKATRAKAAEEGDFDLATDDDAGSDSISLDDGPKQVSKGGFDLAKSYATPYKPKSDDDAHLGPKTPDCDAKPRGTTPVKTPEKAALHGYDPKGKPLVLGRFDYYMTEPEAKFRIWDASGKLAEVSLDITKFAAGSTNDAVVKAHGRDWPVKVVKLPLKKGAVQSCYFSRSIRQDGVNMVPLSLNMSGKQLPALKDGRVPGLDFMKSKGLMTIHICVWAGKTYFGTAKKVVDYAEKIGMKVLLWPGEDPGPGKEGITRDMMLDYLVRPCVFAMQILDEPDLGKPSDESRDFLLHEQARFPYIPQFMNNGTPGIYGHYADGVTDIFMLDNYFTNSDNRSMESVICHVDQERRLEPGKPCWYFHSGSSRGHAREPTYAQQTAQCWGTIAAGGSGVSWFYDFPMSGPNLRAMVDANREMQELKDVICSEEICGGAGADVGPDHLRMTTRRLGKDWYLLTCNIDHKPFEKVTFTLPPDAPQAGTVEVLWENRTLTAKDGQFSDSYPGHFRHVYRIR